MAHIQKVPLPSGRVRWRARWVDGSGKSRSKNFPTQGAAKAHLQTAGGPQGSATITLAQLSEAHIAHFDGLVKSGVREAITRDGYDSVLETHLRPDPIAKTKLCDLTTPIAQDFLDRLVQTGVSAHTVKKVRRTLVTWCRFGQRKGWLPTNPAEPCKVEETHRPDEGQERVTIPPKEQLADLLNAAETPREQAVVYLLMFAGLRISELLGLADEAVALTKAGGKVKVRERLDSRYVKLGPVKSASGRRDVPIGPSAAVAVKAWRLARGAAAQFIHTNARLESRRTLGRLFTSPDGDPLWSYVEFINGCWHPLMRRAGLLQTVRDLKGIPRPVPAFTPHDLRHVAVSLWIAQGLKPKRVQELAGHTSLKMTMDLYGHLWTDDAEDEALAAGSERLISRAPTSSPRGT